MHALNQEHAFTTLFIFFLSLTDEPIMLDFPVKSLCTVVIFIFFLSLTDEPEYNA